MFDNIDSNDFILCPESFRFNCAVYETKCHSCGGCSGDFKELLEYTPIDRDTELRFNKHPFYIKNKKDTKDNLKTERDIKKSTQVFKDKSKQVKTALRTEKKDLKKLGAKLTVGSGRVFNNGDGVIKLSGIEYYIEYKQRFSENASIFPTSAEWTKAISQGCKLFIVNSPKEDTVTMTKEIFLELLSLIPNV